MMWTLRIQEQIGLLVSIFVVFGLLKLSVCDLSYGLFLGLFCQKLSRENELRTYHILAQVGNMIAIDPDQFRIDRSDCTIFQDFFQIRKYRIQKDLTPHNFRVCAQ